jgi:hypothetical protein
MAVQLDVKTDDVAHLVHLKSKNEDYPALLKTLNTINPELLPEVEVRFNNLTCETTIPEKDLGIPNLAKHFASVITCRYDSHRPSVHTFVYVFVALGAGPAK